MTGRFSKRGRNPGAVDCWLDSLGYYRKNVAYDETCLFRAVSEQLFDTQIHHEEVRRACISHGREHWRDFQHAFKRRDWMDRLEKLGIHMVVCTDIEIQLTCNAYRVDATVFKGNSHDVQIFSSQRGEPKRTICLCKMGEDHYDAVYTKDHIITAGFCQSMIYKVLYEKVFEIEDVDSIVNSMLHDKQAPYTIYCPEAELLKKEEDPAEAELSPLPQNGMLAPFPFKIAKALDPSMYRNIEYDTWLELRRELRLGEWYYGDDKLILGTRCLLSRGNEELQCYIQEIFDNDKTKCEVYITKLAERLTVRYADLRPEEDAKPWPLPYRFARNQPLTLLSSPTEGERKGLRKRREKKNHNDDKPYENQESEDVSVSNYEGCPLLMQKLANASSIEPLNGALQTGPSLESLESRTESITLSETVNWSQAYASQEIYQNAAISETSYQNTNDAQYVYTYGTGTNYSPVPVWPSQSNYIMSPDSVLSESSFPSPAEAQTGQKYVFYQPETPYTPPTYVPPQPVPSSPMSTYPTPYNDRLCAPTSPQIEVYPVYPITPGTPVFYTHLGTQVQSPMVQPASPMALYTPPVEMQYMPSPAYIYPPTPPLAWYNSPPVNSQGFIFPQPPASVQNVSNYA